MSTRDVIHVARVIDELMRINNEQANALRAAASALAASGREPPTQAATTGDEALLEEFSKVNNELATLQRSLARKNAELLRLNEQKNRLLGMAVHDLRNPLGVIQSYSEFLRDEAAANLDAEQREFVESILDASRFMLSIIDDLLDVTEFEAGILRLNREQVDLVELVRSNVTLNRVLAARKDVDLDLSIPEHPVLVDADARKIQQVLNNLIANAVKHSQPGKSVQVSLQSSAAQARITVADDGVGIAAADLPDIFQPFGRARRQGTSGEPTTGLGLAIVRRIVEGHGGTIGVTSEPGRGATFSVVLPGAWKT